MKVNELREILKHADGDLEVYVYADHGQSTMVANHAGVQYVESLDYSTDVIAKEDVPDHPDARRVFEIAN